VIQPLREIRIHGWRNRYVSAAEIVFSFLLKLMVMQFAVGSIFYVLRRGLPQCQIAGIHLVPSA
jgi:hypothetical protein